MIVSIKADISLYTREQARLLLQEAMSGNGGFSRAEARSDVILAFNSLSVRHRHVLFLHWQGYTMAEIAQRVVGNPNRKTGSSLVRRAELALLQGLNGRGRV